MYKCIRIHCSCSTALLVVLRGARLVFIYVYIRKCICKCVLCSCSTALLVVIRLTRSADPLRH